jgi:Spy/CpxP family protein refolding chaperone
MKEDIMFKRIVMLLVAAALPVVLAAEEPSPLAVVAHVLSLSDEQVQALGQIMQARSEAIRPAVQEIQARQQALAQQLQSADPDPQTVGQLVIEIKRIEGQIHQGIEESNKQWESVLAPEQSTRLEQIRAAAPACEVIPAFRAVGLM